MIKFANETQNAAPPIVLVLQREHVNEPEKGKFEHVTDERITEWLVEWLTEEKKRKENSIREFLQQKIL